MKRMLAQAAIGAALTFGAAGSVHAAADGKAVFTQLKCNSCHAIASQDIKVVEEEGAEAEEEGEDVQKPSDLSDVGTKRTAAWIKDWLMKKTDLDGKKHRKKFEGKPAELDALATWLATLKQAKK